MIGKRWSARLGGGLALGLANLSYTYNENISFSGAASFNRAGSTSGADFHAGAYAEGKLIFSVTAETSVFAGAQYEYLGTFSRNTGGEQAQLDMGAAVFVLFGLQWSF